MIHGIDTGFLVAAEITEHPWHLSAKSKMADFVVGGDRFAISAQVIAEFIHVVTDGKRFSKPLTMDEARNLAGQWWTASEVIQVAPNDDAVNLFLEWHRIHSLGRKRILDTLLAATYRISNINSLLTTNASDFTVLGGFQCITP